MTQPDEIPEVDIDITVETVTGTTRSIQTSWSMSSAQELRDLWGPRKRRITPLKRLIDVLDDPTYDPDNPPENEFEVPIGVEEDLVERMAAEMTAEIDREIAAEAAAACERADAGLRNRHVKNRDNPPSFDVVLKIETAKAVELATKGIVYDLHDRIMKRMRPDDPEDSATKTGPGTEPPILYHPSYATTT